MSRIVSSIKRRRHNDATLTPLPLPPAARRRKRREAATLRHQSAELSDHAGVWVQQLRAGQKMATCLKRSSTSTTTKPFERLLQLQQQQTARAAAAPPADTGSSSSGTASGGSSSSAGSGGGISRRPSRQDHHHQQQQQQPSLGELTCPACRGLLREPVRLPCGHHLCLGCLRGGGAGGAGTSELLAPSCPLCRQRLGAWLQRAAPSLVDQELWQLIRQRYPEQRPPGAARHLLQDGECVWCVARQEPQEPK